MNALMVGAILLAGVVLGLFIGRRTSAARAKVRQLEVDLADLQIPAGVLCVMSRGLGTAHTTDHLRLIAAFPGNTFSHFTGIGDYLQLVPNNFKPTQGLLGSLRGYGLSSQLPGPRQDVRTIGSL